MSSKSLRNRGFSRRDLLRVGACGVGVGAMAAVAPMPPLFGRMAGALAATGALDGRMLVVFELSGGNDGLNTLVPYGDDAYYQHRPKIGVKPDKLRKIDDHFGFQETMAGFERLYKDGKMAVVHGVGYEQPSFSHFSSMAFWHTGAPNSGEEHGWLGRTADVIDPQNTPSYLVNIDSTQSLAVRAGSHTPVVFDDPNRFTREYFDPQRQAIDRLGDGNKAANPAHRYLLDVARGAKDASVMVRQAWDDYSPAVDYGLVPSDLNKIAALIAAEMPARLFYTSYRNNQFDTHVFQAAVHRRLLTYASDAVSGFFHDLERLGRADDVVMMVFTEFGRRVWENTSLGTDHGTANNVYVIGNNIKGGHYGEVPSLTELDDGNLIHTTDFRRVYSTLIEGWLGQTDSAEILNGRFDPFDMIA